MEEDKIITGRIGEMKAQTYKSGKKKDQEYYSVKIEHGDRSVTVNSEYLLGNVGEPISVKVTESSYTTASGEQRTSKWVKEVLTGKAEEAPASSDVDLLKLIIKKLDEIIEVIGEPKRLPHTPIFKEFPGELPADKAAEISDVTEYFGP
jgi:hypothetical protein